MNCNSTGEKIRDGRMKKGLTQKQLGDALFVSDKTISKWECGQGFPEITMLESIANVLSIDLYSLICDDDYTQEIGGINMKKSVFYVCEKCGNIIISTKKADNMACCGTLLEPLEAKKADEAHNINIEAVEDEWYITSSHPMIREHYISFVALLTSESVKFYKTYPEWDLSLRIEKKNHGTLLWYCSTHGLFYKNI